MKHYHELIRRVTVLAFSLSLAGFLHGQAPEDEDVIELSPFEVNSEGSIGYQARETLAGTRLRTDLRDVANAVSVINQEFLQDTGSTSQEDLLVYTTNTEVGGIQGNFANTGDGNQLDDNDARQEPQTNTRIRGLAEADNTRNFFATDISWDGYNVDRVDIQRGANSVLFGVGSPAGIINTDLIDPVFYDMGKLDLQFGSYGSYRANFDVNKEVIDDVLAIRVAGLFEDTQYRQDPAEEEDSRLFVAGKWNPDFLNTDNITTSISASYETGNIDANRPRILTPIDRITPWFELGQPVYPALLTDGSDYDEYVRLGMPPSYGVANGNGQFSNGVWNLNWNPWIDSRSADWFDGPVAIYGSQDAVHQDFLTTAQFLSNPRDTPAGGPNMPWAPWIGIATVDGHANKMLNHARLIGNADIARDYEGSQIGAFKRRHLSDPSIFDFYNSLLDGPTKYENEEFDTFNLGLSQTYFGDRFGIELVYDEQNYFREYSSLLGDSGYNIAIDMVTTFSNGAANPNTGRAMVGSRGGSSGSRDIDRETLRATAFAQLDFGDFFEEESMLERLLGRHVFTGVWTDSDKHEYELTWERAAAADSYGPGIGSPVNQAVRQIATANYLSPFLQGASLGERLHLSNIKADRQVTSGWMSVWDWTDKFPDVPADNPFKYVGWNGYPVEIWNAETGDRDQLYRAGGARKKLTELESQVFVWQGYLLDDLIVPMFSWRKDEQVFRGSGTPTNATYGPTIFDDPEWYIPSGPDDVGANRVYNDESKETTSWGVVVHTPQFIRDAIGGLNISLFYNESENFQPQAGRVDPFGRPIASPTGETEDYGFVISTEDSRYSFKVNWYETSVSDASLGGSLGGDYLLGMGEAWAYMFATRAKKAYDDNAGFADFGTDFTIVDGVDTDPDKFLPYAPRSGQSLADAEQEFLNAVNGFLNNPPPQELQDAWGYDVDAWAQNPGDWLNVTYLDGMAITGDTHSEGIEFEFAAQVMPNWNITFNASKSDATRLNIAQPIADWVEERYAFYQTDAGQVRFWGPWVNDGETLRGKFTREFYGNYQLQRLLEGANVPELRQWRFNLITNYIFDSGPLNGMNIGGALRWQDKVVIGYPVLNSADPLDASSLPTYDVSSPFYGPEETNIDLWIGYERPITEHIDWRIQLNVRNLFSDDKLIPITAQPDGTPAAYRIPDETTWFITNTFSF